MKKKSLIFILTVSMVFIMSAFLTGCDNKDDENVQVKDTISVVISVTYPEESGLEPIKDAKFTIDAGTTVNDVLQLYCNVEGISTTMDTTAGTVTGINGVENQGSDGLNWHCELNGKQVKDPTSQTHVKSGDTVHWTYR